MAFFRDIQDKVILGRWRFLNLKNLSGATKHVGVDSNGMLGLVEGGGGEGSSINWDNIEEKPEFGTLAVQDKVAVTDIEATGTLNTTNFLRGDGIWTNPNRNFGFYNFTASRNMTTSDLDRNRKVVFNGANLQYHIPFPATGFSNGGAVNIVNLNSTNLEITVPAGATLISTDNKRHVASKSEAQLTYMNNDQWLLTGGLTTPLVPQITPLGFAMVNGTTTGGEGGEEVTVSTLSELKSAVSGNTARIVYINGTITGAGQESISCGNNKTVIGLPGSMVIGASFFVYAKNNLIFRNLTMRYYVGYAGIQVRDGSHHVWIDHCDFGTDRLPENGWEYWGKDIAINTASDYVTVSWCRFHDNNKSLLIGSADDDFEDIGKLHITLHNNYWYDCSEREPSMYFGHVHMFNNYHRDNSGYCIGTRSGGTVRTDNEYFENCTRPIRTKISTSPDGYVGGIDTNIYENCGTNLITTELSDWIPEYDYSQWLSPASEVPALVEANAGATLTI